MTSQQIFLSIIRAIHDLGSFIWVGGLIVLVFVIMPVKRKITKNSDEINIIFPAIYKRLMILISITIPFLFVTGILLARNNPSFKGILNFTNLYSTILSIKIMLVVLMIALILPRRKSLKQFMQSNSIEYEKKSETFVTINMILGIIVTFLSCLLI